MTVERYLEIRKSYGITCTSIPDNSVIENMTEEECHLAMEKLCEIFKEVFGKEKTK